MSKIIRITILVLLFILLGLYNIQNQYTFSADSARGTLKSLRILRQKEITFVGPPLSLGLNTEKELYFSSLIYYLGAFGLFISNSNPLILVIIIVIINASAVIPLFLLFQEKTQSNKITMFGILFYCTNPIVIIYSRMFWNPSPVIGLSIWALYLINKFPLVAGVLVGVCVHFHYVSILLIFILLILLHPKTKKNIFYFIFGIFTMLLPFTYFEIKNNFYLVKTLIYNIKNIHSSNNFYDSLLFFLNVPLLLLGFTKDFFGERIILIPKFASMVIGFFLWVFLYIKNSKSALFYGLLLSSIITSIISQTYFRTQYMFPFIGIFIFIIVLNLYKSKYTFIIILLIAIQSIQTYITIYSQAKTPNNEHFPTVKVLEAFTNDLKSYKNLRTNITENIVYDNRAMYLRFFLEKENMNNLQNEFNYNHLDSLFVLSTSVEKTEKNKSWELTASNLKFEKIISTREGFVLLQYNK